MTLSSLREFPPRGYHSSVYGRFRRVTNESVALGAVDYAQCYPEAPIRIGVGNHLGGGNFLT
jgi:hypothetical protein